MNLKDLLKEETPEQFANRNFSDPEEKILWLKASELRSKYTALNKFKPGTPPNIKKLVNKAWSDLEKYRKNKEKKSANINDVKRILKNSGLGVAKWRGSRIRGYSTLIQKGYEFDPGNVKSINFYGINKELFNNILNALKYANFEISSYEEPAPLTGGSNKSRIQIK